MLPKLAARNARHKNTWDHRIKPWLFMWIHVSEQSPSPHLVYFCAGNCSDVDATRQFGIGKDITCNSGPDFCLVLFHIRIRYPSFTPSYHSLSSLSSLSSSSSFYIPALTRPSMSMGKSTLSSKDGPGHSRLFEHGQDDIIGLERTPQASQPYAQPRQTQAHAHAQAQARTQAQAEARPYQPRSVLGALSISLYQSLSFSRSPSFERTRYIASTCTFIAIIYLRTLHCLFFGTGALSCAVLGKDYPFLFFFPFALVFFPSHATLPRPHLAVTLGFFLCLSFGVTRVGIGQEKRKQAASWKV